jgi:hypothetical protein
MIRPAATIGAAMAVAALATTPSAQSPPKGGAPRPAARSIDVTAHKDYGTHFETSERCFPCHNGVTTKAGEDISVGISWRTSMMGNAGRDPYWMAGVRRETIDHPAAAAAIQDECTICHMPMMRYEAKLAGGDGEVFAHLPPDPDKLADRMAEDGVSCTVCHQITDQNLGTRESFVGRFRIDETLKPGQRRAYGPFEPSVGHTTIMKSSSTFTPQQGNHIRSSELCATCHTLLTQALDAQGNVIGELPEQVPYQEWLHSDFRDTRSCQSCHMPVVAEDVPASSVFGQPRQGVSRHTFVGGNFFMQRILNKFRNDLSVRAMPQEMDAAVNRTIAHLQNEAATVSVEATAVQDGRLDIEVGVNNLGGHKLPTGYPSRRAWLHLLVRDRSGQAVFESGALGANGAITGNDSDEDAGRVEPHYTTITRPDQVQIYESVMAGADGSPTTGLLSAVRFVKDNRILPRGFDKHTADQDVAVHGEAEADADFSGGGDRLKYSIGVEPTQGPFQVTAELWYQPIAYRWAMNLKKYDAPETRRFVSYYEQTSESSGVMLARAGATK